jgi:ectoine hydroxylase-related dioxygenase (phytanoyl-CoA dioxygenase family)
MPSPAARLALHPFNTGFEWRAASRGEGLAPGQVAQFDEQGFLLYEGAFDADTVARAIAEIDPFEQRVEAFLRTQQDGRLFIARAGEITFSTHLVARSRFLRELSAAPPILAACRSLVGPDVRLYWDQAVYKKPGTAQEFPFHQDNGYTYIEPQQYLTCWVALTDTDERNGCPWVIPGWHRFGTLAHEETPLGWRCVESSPASVPVPARAGDIVVFSSLTPHRTGPNLSDAVRKSYILQYAPDGACARSADPRRAGPQDDPERQYPVLCGGEPVRVKVPISTSKP